MVNSNVTTITLDGSETAVKFSQGYPYYFVTNNGSEDIYVSKSPNITPYADGVYTVPASGTTRIGEGYSFDGLYVSGTGKVQIRGERIAAQPSFSGGVKGGETSGAGLDIKIVEALPQKGESKFLYLVPKNNLLSDNIYDEYLWAENKWEKIGDTEIDLTGYARKEDIPDVSDFVSNPDDLNIMVMKNSKGSTISSSAFTFSDSVSINTNFPLLNKLPNGEERTVIAREIPAATQSKAGVMTAADKAKLDELSAPQLLKSDTDLNDITKPGFYYCPSNSVVTTFKNCPTNIAFSLLVEEHVGCGQTLTEWRKDEFRIYHRNGGADSIYGNWERLYTSADPPANATESADGFMSAADKVKLDSITPEMLEKLKNL